MMSENNLNKLNICVLNTQQGKTFIAIKKMILELEQDQDLGKSIHIVFTMNTLLNNRQFAKRLQSIEYDYGKGSVCIFASKYESNEYLHVKSRYELQGVCFDKNTCPKVIVMCSNNQRYEDGIEFLKVMNENTGYIKSAIAYYDELHKYINTTLRNQIEMINELNIVQGIHAMTATPDKIWRDNGLWSKLQLTRLENFNCNNYVSVESMKFIPVDDYFSEDYQVPRTFDYNKLDYQVLGFIEHVLKNNTSILQDNTRAFIPAHMRRSGHNQLRDMIFAANNRCVVITLNGIEKSVKYIKNSEKVTINLESSDDEEICDVIARTLFKNSLLSRPIVITGFLCVGMGQTLMNEQLGPFTSCIISHMDLTNDDLYQLFGRITGRTKSWNNFVQTNVFCPTISWNRCITMEKCARNMAAEHNGSVVTQQDYRQPMYETDMGKHAVENIRVEKTKSTNLREHYDEKDKCHQEFENQVAAILFVKQKFNHKLSKRASAMAPKTLLENDQNPTTDKIMKRMWGINSTNKLRMIPNNENKWIVYWRPSLMKESH